MTEEIKENKEFNINNNFNLLQKIEELSLNKDNSYILGLSQGILLFLERNEISSSVENCENVKEILKNNLNNFQKEQIIANSVENYEFEFLCEETPKIDLEQFDTYKIENEELKKLNEILEREINLLKSLILINNLNLNSSDSKSCKIKIIIHSISQ